MEVKLGYKQTIVEKKPWASARRLMDRRISRNALASGSRTATVDGHLRKMEASWK